MVPVAQEGHLAYPPPFRTRRVADEIMKAIFRRAMSAKDATLALKRLGYEYVPGPTKSPSDMVLKPKFAWNGQKNYDEVADACTNWVKSQLVPRCGLVALDGVQGCAYASPSLAKHTGPVLLCVHGYPPGGDCGVWGRALCINDSTLSGAMFETIARAHSRGWAVIVADPHGCGPSGAPHKHLLDLYRLTANNPILILGHSNGASLSIGMLKVAEAADGAAAVARKVHALALTDGMVWTPASGWRGGASLVHEGLSALASDDELNDAAGDDAAALTALTARRAQLRKWVEIVPSAFDPPSDSLLRLLAEVGRNWVVSDLPLGTRVPGRSDEKVMPTVSAAHTSHPATTYAALDDVFAFLDRAAGRRKRGRAQASASAAEEPASLTRRRAELLQAALPGGLAAEDEEEE